MQFRASCCKLRIILLFCSSRLSRRPPNQYNYSPKFCLVFPVEHCWKNRFALNFWIQMNMDTWLELAGEYGLPIEGIWKVYLIASHLCFHRRKPTNVIRQRKANVKIFACRCNANTNCAESKDNHGIPL